MINKLQEDWPEIIEKMKIEYSILPAPFNLWIKPLTVYAIEDSTVTLLVPDELDKMCEHVKKKYGDYIVAAISEHYNAYYDVNITCRANVEQNKAVPIHKPGPVNTNSTLNPKYTFDTFVVGKNNELAHATAMAVASDPGEYANPLFIYGGVGLGKTHLMQSVAHQILAQNPDYKIIYTTTETFSSELINAIKTKKTEVFKDKYRTIDMLLIDDIQFIANKDSTMEEFFHTFNTLYDNKKQIIISADKPPKDIVGIEERLISRFRAGVTVDVQSPDYDTRVAILAKRAELENITISEPALHYIAERIVSNIRELEGALKQISNFARLNKTSKIDIDLTKSVLKDIISPNESRPITPELIIETVVDHYNNQFTAADIKGSGRSKIIAEPRQIIMYLCHKYTDLSLAAIGSNLGGKDHTTVLHGVRKIEKSINESAELKNTINIITKKLNPPK